jgi:hypothetical protein
MGCGPQPTGHNNPNPGPSSVQQPARRAATHRTARFHRGDREIDGVPSSANTGSGGPAAGAPTARGGAALVAVTFAAEELELAAAPAPAPPTAAGSSANDTCLAWPLRATRPVRRLRRYIATSTPAVTAAAASASCERRGMTGRHLQLNRGRDLPTNSTAASSNGLSVCDNLGQTVSLNYYRTSKSRRLIPRAVATLPHACESCWAGKG